MFLDGWYNFAYLQGPGNGSNASTSSSSTGGASSATAASAAAASAPSSNRLEMPFASVPESVPALSGGKGKGAAMGGQTADAVPATLPPRKNYDDDSNGALRHDRPN